MICTECRNQVHHGCRGETWCDCQHRISGLWPELLTVAEDFVPGPHTDMPPNGAKSTPLEPEREQ